MIKKFTFKGVLLRETQKTKTPAVLFGMPVIVLAFGLVLGGCRTLQALFQPAYQSITVTPPAKTVFAQGEEGTFEGLQVAGVTKKG
jgi:hypothetical protein